MCNALSCFDMIPYTLAVDCGSLTDPTNGTVDASPTTFMSTATYTCNTGYNINGGNTSTCQANGTWSGSEPTCDSTLYCCSSHTLLLWPLSSLQLSPVQPSLSLIMERSVYQATTLRALLPTPVTKATI